MKITERLKVEHGVYLLQLRHLEQLMQAHPTGDVLAAVVRTIAVAEEHHSRLEDTVLYPALARIVGESFDALVQIKQDHLRLAELASAAIASGAEQDVQAFIVTLRAHLEREIHQLFPLAEEVLSESLLASLGNWQEDHVYQEMGQPERWQRTPRT